MLLPRVDHAQRSMHPSWGVEALTPGLLYSYPVTTELGTLA